MQKKGESHCEILLLVFQNIHYYTLFNGNVLYGISKIIFDYDL